MAVTTKRVAIVGQGVMGLTCAARMLEQGYSVNIFSREEFTDTTSMSAGAYWWPHKTYPEERVSKWSKETYKEYAKSSLSIESGVHFERHRRFCIDPDDSAYARHLVDEWEEIDGHNYGISCCEAYLVVLPVIDVPIFMPYLKNHIESHGAEFHIKELESPAQLFPTFDLVINCSGVWAFHFVKDKEVFPIRGQIVKVSLTDKFHESTRIYQKEDTFTLILPRSNDIILGGTAQYDDWGRDSRSEDTDIILKRCRKLVPEISDCEVLGTAVGLRPGRKEVRLELELIAPNRPVIHNYGHGGGGYTVAWGCANEVTALANEYFSG